MAKDLKLLSGVSKYFTEETLREVLRKSSGENEVTVTGWSFKPLLTKGDSYLAQVDRITVNGKAGGKDIEIKLVVKSLPKNLGRRKTFRSVEFFYNEITFYKEVIPVFENFLESKGQKNLLCVPHCFDAMVDGENDYLIMEDVTVHGFGPISRQACLNLEQMNVLLRAMANFHAISFAYKDQNKDKFEDLVDKLIETFFSTHWEWYKNLRAILIRVARDALAKEYPGHPAEKKFNSYESNKILWDRSAVYCNRWHAPTSVINQGDSWAPNFLVRKINGGNEEEAMLLDFQLARSSSPVLDLSFLFFACSDKQLLDDHYDEMLKTYHSILSSSIKSLGSDPEKLYPWSVFEEEVKEQSIHGLNFALESVPFSVMEESEAFDLDDLIKTDDAVDVAEIFNVQNIKTSEGRRRLAELILHAHSKGFF